MVIPLWDMNQRRNFPLVTVTLIAVNLAFFLYQLNLGLDTQAGIDFVNLYGTIPSLVLAAEPECADQLDVPSWRLDAPAGKHVFPVGIRRQYRGFPGSDPPRPLLPVDGRGSQSQLHPLLRIVSLYAECWEPPAPSRG